ncbi:MAG: fatty acid desaturase [Proteobacteria bacterium]|nr:fatty acid desaturase [Pseudomonadota bacterium]
MIFPVFDDLGVGIGEAEKGLLRRGVVDIVIGEVGVLTVAEYTSLPGWKRLAYRLYRTPAVILGVGPFYVFAIKHRLPLDLIRRHPSLLISIMVTNLGIGGAMAVMAVAFGFIDLLMVQLPVVLLSSTAGVWLFYVQHQFEFTYWQNQDRWDFQEASVMASSYYDLPQPLRWFSGNIGIHHIHHLSCRIPNYRLQACLAAIPALQSLNRIGLRESISGFRLALWDENAQRLVGFKNLRRLQLAGA